VSKNKELETCVHWRFIVNELAEEQHVGACSGRVYNTGFIRDEEGKFLRQTRVQSISFIQKRQRSPSPDEIEEIAPPMYRNSARETETPEIEEIALPIVHLDSVQSTPDIEIVPFAATPGSEALAQSAPVPDCASDHVQPYATIDNTIEQLADKLKDICIGCLEKTLNPIDHTDGMEVDKNVDALTEEFRVRDLLQ
jgi:hypothetical protein